MDQCIHKVNMSISIDKKFQKFKIICLEEILSVLLIHSFHIVKKFYVLSCDQLYESGFVSKTPTFVAVTNIFSNVF